MWMGTIGQDKADPNVYYSMLLLGFFKDQLSLPCKTSVKSWFERHPGAEITPIATESKFDTRNPKSKLVFVWVIDGDDNLILNLVRTGCLPAGLVTTLAPGTELLISQTVLDRMKTEIVAAEKLAKRDKLGIWSDAAKETEGE